jgi:PAS domain-containing protein
MSLLNKEVTLLQLLVAVISSGFLTSVGTGYFQNNDTSSLIASQQYSDLITTTISELDKAKRRIEKLERRNEQMFVINSVQESEIKNLRRDFYLLQSSASNVPIAEWTKDLTYRMLSVNSYFEDLFLLPRSLTAADYIGEVDSVIWGKKIADHFRDQDKQVISTGVAMRFVEKFPDGRGGSYTLFVVKYPRKIAGITLGVGGAAIVLDGWLEEYLNDS